MWRVSEWAVLVSRRSNERALHNARAATTALSRLRVEREEVELFLQERWADSGAEQPASLPAAVPARAGSLA